MHNIVYGAITAGGIAVASLSGIGIVSDKMSEPPIEGYASRVTPVVAGQPILAYWNILKRTKCPGASSRVWNGEGSFSMVEPLRKTTLKGNEVWTKYRIQTDIPSLAPVGGLDLYIKGYYDCGDGPIEFTLGPLELVVVSGD